MINVVKVRVTFRTTLCSGPILIKFMYDLNKIYVSETVAFGKLHR